MTSARPLLAGIALLAACAPNERSGDESLATSRAPIIHGTDSPSAEDAVVAVAMRPGGAFAGLCSGTLVAPNLLLTARHCVGTVDLPVGCTADGTAYVGGGTHDYLASEISIYRGTAASADLIADIGSGTGAVAYGAALVVDGNNLCNADVAFVVLDRDVSGPIAPIRRASVAAVGEQVTAVGFGRVETGDLPSVRKHRTDVFVTRVGSMTLPGMAPYGLGDAELTVSESGCSGDSGGPIIAANGAISGVLSRAGGGSAEPGNPAGHCVGSSALAIYTHLATKPALVAQAFAAAGHSELLPGTPTPDAGAADAPSDAAKPDAKKDPPASPAPSASSSPNEEEAPATSTEPRSEEKKAPSGPAGASCTACGADVGRDERFFVTIAIALLVAYRGRRRSAPTTG
jgi:hypothetical protein